MPLFRRPDGAIVRDVAPVRRIMPYLMPTRNESVVYHENVLDLTRTTPWLQAFNAARPDRDKATLFHLLLWACARALRERPGHNRFVNNGRSCQRNGVFLFFAPKRGFRDDAPLATRP